MKIKCIFFLILCFILSSCSFYTRKVQLKTTPSHARASLLPENKKSCITPCKLEVPSSVYKIKITKEGYNDKIVANPERPPYLYIKNKTIQNVVAGTWVVTVVWLSILDPSIILSVIALVVLEPAFILDDKLKVNLE